MCRTKQQGGRRCPAHSRNQATVDARNARRRARYAQQVDEKSGINGVSPTWQEYGFESPRNTRRGWGNNEEARDRLAELENIGEPWRDSLSREEDGAVSLYSMSGYDYINRLSRSEEDYRKWMATSEKSSYRHLAQSRPEEFESYVTMHKGWLVNLDTAIARVPQSDQPRTLYRSFIVHDENVNNKEYAEQNFAVGTTIKNSSYLSTCADSDFSTRYAKKHGQKNIIVFEILSREGAILHQRSSGGFAGVQEDEREILLPRDTELRVVGVHHRVKFESSRKIERYVDVGDKYSVTVVQVVDEKLLNQESNEEV